MGIWFLEIVWTPTITALLPPSTWSALASLEGLGKKHLPNLADRITHAQTTIDESTRCLYFTCHLHAYALYLSSFAPRVMITYASPLKMIRNPRKARKSLPLFSFLPLSFLVCSISMLSPCQVWKESVSADEVYPCTCLSGQSGAV